MGLPSQRLYPKFSWGTTPRYFMFGDENRVLSPEQVRFIAEQTDFLCIEKSHGMEQLGAAELGTENMKRRPSKRSSLASRCCSTSTPPMPGPTPRTTRISPGTVSKRQLPELKEFLIIHPETGKLADRYGTFCFDVLNPDFRDWWVETVAKGVRETGCDGAFIDQMHGSVALRPQVKGRRSKRPWAR